MATEIKVECQGPTGTTTATAAKRAIDASATGTLVSVTVVEDANHDGLFVATLTYDESDPANEPLGSWGVTVGGTINTLTMTAADNLVGYKAELPNVPSVDDITTAISGVPVASGEFLLTATVLDPDESPVVGAKGTLLNSSGEIVRVATSKPSGVIEIGAPSGTYTLVVTGGLVYETNTQVVVLSESKAVDVDLAEVSGSSSGGSQTGTVHRVTTATDWDLSFNIGSLTGVDWTKILFTLKASPVEEDDDEKAMLQVQLTNGGDSSDGLIRLKRIAPAGDVTKDNAELTVDPATGDVDVHVDAVASELIPPTDQDYWEASDSQLDKLRGYRLSDYITPPVYHWDVKRVDEDGKASASRKYGLTVVDQAVTQRTS